MAQTWLHEWIGQQGVTNLRQATRALHSDGALDQLEELASQPFGSPEPVGSGEAWPIVAAGPIDLSGELSCAHPDCQIRQVDDLFNRVWHYFDPIVVAGPSSVLFRSIIDQDRERTLQWLLGQVQVLLYLREIGAEEHLRYSPRGFRCDQHWDEHAQEAGLHSLLTNVDDRVQGLEAEAKLLTRPSDIGGRSLAKLNHPAFPDGPVREVDDADLDVEALKREMAHDLYMRHSQALIQDAWAAKKFGAPLGATSTLPLFDMQESRVRATEDEIAFQMRLPYISGLSAREVLGLAHEERLAMERFRTAIRAAIQERARQTAEDADPAAVARQIVRDIIEPAVNDVQQRLNLAERRLSRKAAVEVAVGTTVATAGALFALPPLVGLGSAAVVGSVRHASAYIDERTEIKLSAMFFAWRLERESVGS